MKFFILSGAIANALAVLIGAFGAHGLKDILKANGQAATFDTGVKYHFYHALALLVLGLVYERLPVQWLNYSGYAFIAGIFIFSGSLYLLSITNLKWLGAITPLGGLCFVAGWVMLALAAIKS